MNFIHKSQHNDRALIQFTCNYHQLNVSVAILTEILKLSFEWLCCLSGNALLSKRVITLNSSLKKQCFSICSIVSGVVFGQTNNCHHSCTSHFVPVRGSDGRTYGESDTETLGKTFKKSDTEQTKKHSKSLILNQ